MLHTYLLQVGYTLYKAINPAADQRERFSRPSLICRMLDPIDSIDLLDG